MLDIGAASRTRRGKEEWWHTNNTRHPPDNDGHKMQVLRQCLRIPGYNRTISGK